MKIFLIVLTICCTTFSYAQEKGQWIIGGNASYNSDKNDNETESSKTESFILSPSIGYMINSKVAIGISLSHSSVNDDRENHFYGYSYNYKTASLSLNPFVRFHKNITEKFKLYIQPGVFYSSHKVEYDESENDLKFKGYGIDCRLGFLYFISDKLSMELSLLSLNYSKLKEDDGELEQEHFAIDYDLTSPNIGLRYYF